MQAAEVVGKKPERHGIDVLAQETIVLATSPELPPD